LPALWSRASIYRKTLLSEPLEVVASDILVRISGLAIYRIRYTLVVERR